MLEGIGGLEKLVNVIPYEQVLFGSHFPFFNFEATRLKLKESEVGRFVLELVTIKNPRRLFARPNE
jgi:hypothetical protein